MLGKRRLLKKNGFRGMGTMCVHVHVHVHVHVYVCVCTDVYLSVNMFCCICVLYTLCVYPTPSTKLIIFTSRGLSMYPIETMESIEPSSHVCTHVTQADSICHVAVV